VTGQRIVGALFVDMESAPPRARYECLLCGIREGPAVGRGKVAEFVATIRARHHQTHHQQKAAAA
jgi:hypothetical protein